jgi:peroxiredoxin
MAGQAQLNVPAPEFELADYQGRVRRLSEFRGRQHVLLVFNRGFT